MTLAYLIDLNLINKYEKVEIRNLPNCMTCDAIKIDSDFKSDNPLIVNNSWGVDILNWQVSHIYTQEDIICITLVDPRGELRDIRKKEKEYLLKSKRGTLNV